MDERRGVLVVTQERLPTLYTKGTRIKDARVLKVLGGNGAPFRYVLEVKPGVSGMIRSSPSPGPLAKEQWLEEGSLTDTRVRRDGCEGTTLQLSFPPPKSREGDEVEAYLIHAAKKGGSRTVTFHLFPSVPMEMVLSRSDPWFHRVFSSRELVRVRLVNLQALPVALAPAGD